MPKEKTKALAARLKAKRIAERAAKRRARRPDPLNPAEQAAYDAARSLDANALEDAVLLLEAAADDARKTREAMLPALRRDDPEAAREFLAGRSTMPCPAPYERARRYLEIAHRRAEQAKAEKRRTAP